MHPRGRRRNGLGRGTGTQEGERGGERHGGETKKKPSPFHLADKSVLPTRLCLFLVKGKRKVRGRDGSSVWEAMKGKGGREKDRGGSKEEEKAKDGVSVSEARHPTLEEDSECIHDRKRDGKGEEEHKVA